MSFNVQSTEGSEAQLTLRKITTESEDATNGTTAAHTKTSSESEKGQIRTLSGRGGHGYRGNATNNTRDSLESTNKDYRSKIEAFGAVLALKYEIVELNKFFGHVLGLGEKFCDGPGNEFVCSPYHLFKSLVL